MRALTRVASPTREGELIELAAALTASQLERSLAAYRRVPTSEARELGERAELHCFWDEDGCLVVRGRLAPEDGALLLRAMEAAREQLWQAGRVEAGGSAEPPLEPRRPTNAEALVALADRSLTGESGRSGAERYQVVVHVDEAALAIDGDGACVLEDGPALAPETARRLACDASRIVTGPHGPERRTRTIPSALRRALRARDRGCRFPGCTNHRHVDAHHVEHWARGGPTTLDNLLLLCRRHHRLVHEGGYRVDRQGRFRDRYGNLIPPTPPQPPGHIATLRRRNHRLGITPKTCRNGYGDRMDIGLAVDSLIQVITRPPPLTYP